MSVMPDRLADALADRYRIERETILQRRNALLGPR